jgi:hypothetical protein
LGLLLGFTFSMSVGRYETRRTLVLTEANSIGTTYLRAAFLSEAHQRGVEELLRRYVDVRLDFYAAGHDEERIAAAEKAAAQLQRELWTHTVAAAREVPSPMVASFVAALNDTIDLDATRYNAMRAHVPVAVWLLVLVTAGAGCYASGYGAGACGVRNSLSNILLPLLVTALITLVSDLDRPRQGLVGISQQPLLDLKASFSIPSHP